MGTAQSELNVRARELFAPLADSYDRYARLLSFGQDPRWRRFLASRIDAGPEDIVLDVATGTAAVAIELARRYGCSVVGVDQSPEMLAEGHARVAKAGLDSLVQLHEARAEELPFPDEHFDALTFTYLLRYVEDPAATLNELARVVQPGGRIAMLEFLVPSSAAAHRLWNLYVDLGLPVLGRLVSTGWAEVGRFLGPSIRSFYERFPLEHLLALWRDAGIGDAQARQLSLGGGVVVWGTRGH